MSKVAILTDTTVNLPDEMIHDLNISLVHQILIWNEKSYLDLIDIQNDEFYRKLRTEKTSPTTSQASVGEFKDVYGHLINKGYEVLAILLSHKLSGTIQSATQAKDYYPGAPIEIFDSYATSLAMGWQVLEVARAAKRGAGMKECIALAEKARANSGVVFVVDTLEYLHRGGRIGGAARFLGTALNLKPILELGGWQDRSHRARPDPAQGDQPHGRGGAGTHRRADAGQDRHPECGCGSQRSSPGGALRGDLQAVRDDLQRGQPRDRRACRPGHAGHRLHGRDVTANSFYCRKT